jgi:hypothetical protein
MLILYIKATMEYRPDLKVWGSPWCPLYWMKTNNHYPCRPDPDNGLLPGQTGQEGTSQFRMNPDKSLILIVENKENTAKKINIEIGKKGISVQLEPLSFNTIKLKSSK